MAKHGIMIKIYTRVTDKQYRRLQNLVENGEYPNIAEAAREAVRKFLQDKENLSKHE